MLWSIIDKVSQEKRPTNSRWHDLEVVNLLLQAILTCRNCLWWKLNPDLSIKIVFVFQFLTWKRNKRTYPWFIQIPMSERRASRQFEASTEHTHFSNYEVLRDRYIRPLHKTVQLHGARRASDATTSRINLKLLIYTSTHEKSNLRRPQRSKP